MQAALHTRARVTFLTSLCPFSAQPLCGSPTLRTELTDMTLRSCHGLAFAVSRPHASPPTGPATHLGVPSPRPQPLFLLWGWHGLSFVKYSALPLIHQRSPSHPSRPPLASPACLAVPESPGQTRALHPGFRQSPRSVARSPTWAGHSVSWISTSTFCKVN